MSPPLSHDAHTASQFGSRAADYVASAVHAAGEDLAALARFGALPHAAVLDLGCGGGHVTYAVAPQVRSVTALDLSQAMLDAVTAEAQRRGLANVATRQASVEALPFADASFNCVLSRYSAHHWGDVPAALREAHRVLAPGGRLGLVDVVHPGSPLLDTHLQAWELLRDPSHVRDYGEAEWRRMLAEAGFVPGAVRRWRVRMEFSSWVARMGTPEASVAAIRALQTGAPEPVRFHFALEDDGSFTLDVMMIEAEPDGVLD
ncbi:MULTISPECIES: class I SAM-dependent methyltransferase [Methylorubrum]|uniref:class I SAM-dependent methyltransferase n=1 Tax=Methylorubrum TaxID=2282523 RepID=UPI00209F29B8|nr:MULTISPECIES: class I SAM-dependent methyltransferase [Methylorubrum]MCP1550805.1 ubiquinone/menaquinone biosynthesis C-methylase UbiE [Methylorubrum zatmanii]MCP1552582.1 ubiquinone/menaquinone biosynthesis C-methylase UbiE [Methylorubrum extorquens]MCP1581108.1 ubiquinone/menaquinone biosynthesis C-methylase UbiE [Methylorubrum extorquens]